MDDGVCLVVLTFTSVDKILCCDHSNEISLEVLSCGVLCFKKIYKMKCGIFVQFAFWSYLAVKGLRKDQLTKKRDRIVIKDLIGNEGQGRI